MQCMCRPGRLLNGVYLQFIYRVVQVKDKFVCVGYWCVTLNKDLNASREGESAGSAGRLFQSLAVLGEKDDAYTWLVHRGKYCEA